MSDAGYTRIYSFNNSLYNESENISPRGDNYSLIIGEYYKTKGFIMRCERHITSHCKWY